MKYSESREQLATYRHRIFELRQQMRQLQAEITPEVVKDYEFSGAGGPVSLSALFGNQDSLFVVHNMGVACNYCSLWADGFNGLIDQIESRASFVIASPDSPAVQQKLAARRGWRFKMLSHEGTTFAADMGYTSEHGFEPGVSVFKLDGDHIVRVSDATFGPGDDFCSIWHLFDMLPKGANGWQPR